MAYDVDDAAGREARTSDRRPPRGIRSLLTVPLAVASAVAVTLGIAQPAEAAPQPAKRSPKAKTAAAATATAAVASAEVPREVLVAEGDTVSGIAERYGLSTAEVLAHNGLGWSSLIFPGQRLALPGGKAPAAPAPRERIAKHTIVAGDTMSGIAARYGLELDDLLRVNGLGRQSLIFPGEQVVLPPGGAAPSAAPAPEPSAPPAAADPAPTVASVSAVLTDEMRANARLIVDVGRELGVPDRGIVIALAAAAQESGLKNVRHGDRDSQGLFQQRPSQGWGTSEEVLDAHRAVTAFYGGPNGPNVGRAPGLLDVPGWESMPLTEAAQAVQHSAHPGHYAKWEAQATAWLSELG